ncbi:MAG: glycosyl transferase, family 51 [Frankiales bacterium]|nr:glycosyl transferase, family 51 [Frankiales bacterium]
MGQHGAVTWLRSLSWKKRIGLGAAALLAFFVVFLVLGFALTSVPAPNKIATAQATRLLYADGKTEIGRIGKNRTIVPISRISKDAQHAVLAAEDRDFYSEAGISPKGIARALFTNVKGGGVSQGGSTITQQYAKNAFLTQQRTFTRKIKEVFIAMKMSQTVSKDTILADYLNTIYFGRGAYGIQAASQAYFHVNAADLKPSQAAVLASSIRSPAGYDPTKHPDKAKSRWSYVLDGMVTKGWLAKDVRDSLKYPSVYPIKANSFNGPLDGVRAQVIDELQRHGFPEDRITAGGLTVVTTISKPAEDAAIASVEAVIPDPTGAHPPVGALVSVQPGSGKVVAYYGTRRPGDFDYANGGAGVQPGSSMKPYVLAAALASGKSLDTQYDGSSPQTVCGQLVHNDSGDPAFGQIDLSTALEYSVNTVYLHLACDVGPQKVADIAHAAGIPQGLLGRQGGLSAQIALGSGGYEVHPLDQAAGYATFAARGKAAKPYFVQKVMDGGDSVYNAKTSTSEAFSPDVAADATSAMEKVVAGGTGTRAQLNGRPTAGKTGTTGNNANAWFIGFTPQLATAVWIGRDGGGPLKGVTFKTGAVSGGVYGGTLPAGIFKSFMDKALEGKPVEQFPPRAGIGAVSTPTVTSSPLPTATVTATPTQTPSQQPTQVPTAVPTTLPPVVQTTPPPTAPPSDSPSPTASP